MESKELEKLISDHTDQLRRYVWRVTGQQDDDLLQDFWVNLWKANNEVKYDPSRTEFLPWAFTVLSNLSKSNHRYRRRKKRGGDMKQHELADAHPDGGIPGPIDKAIMEEGSRALNDCLKATTKDNPTLLQLLLMRFWLGLTYKEMGEKQKMAPTTALSKISNAKQSLKRCLEYKGYKTKGDFYAD